MDLVINADDCGMQLAFNNAILKAHRNGVLTSTSVCALGPAVDDAAERVFPQCPGLGVGAHLTLTVGKGLTSAGNPPGGLFLPDGGFRPCLKGYLWYRAHALPGTALRNAVKDELRAQIETLLKRFPLDHADSHHHVHMIPWIFEIVLELCEEYRIPFVRFTEEKLSWREITVSRPGVLLGLHWLNMRLMALHDRWMLRRHPQIRHNAAFRGLIHSGRMRTEFVVNSLENKNLASPLEILLHPAEITPKSENAPYLSEEMCDTIHSAGRAEEMQALLAPETRQAVDGSGWRLTNYRELAAALQKPASPL